MDKTRGHAAAIITILCGALRLFQQKYCLQAFTGGNIVLPFCYRLSGSVCHLPAAAALWRPAARGLFYRSGAYRHLPLLFAGKHCPYLYAGFQCRCAALHGSVFTALAGFAASRGKERPHRRFIFGFVLAMAGIYLISTAESGMQFNLTGDILALSAAAVWALYAVLTRKITTFGYNTILITRHIFFYGLLFMLPALYIFGFTPDLTRFYNPAYLFNILFLGLGASAMCFVTWNYAVKVLGAVKTSAYIYAVPVLTVASAVIVLNEPVTVKMLAGGVLIILGLLFSQKA